MRNSLIAKLIGCLFLYPLSINSACSKNIDNVFLSTQLEESLNQKKYDLMKDLFLKKSFNNFNKEYLNFKKSYKDPKWSIKTISNNSDKTILHVKITSKRKIGDQIFNLNSSIFFLITFKSDHEYFF